MAAGRVEDGRDRRMALEARSMNARTNNRAGQELFLAVAGQIAEEQAMNGSTNGRTINGGTHDAIASDAEYAWKVEVAAESRRYWHSVEGVLILAVYVCWLLGVWKAIEIGIAIVRYAIP